MTKGFVKVPHIIWESKISLEEKTMLCFLLDCEDKFKKNGEWFNLSDEDFIAAGYGSCKSRWRKYRDGLISKGLIEFKKGGPGRKSRYHIAENLEDVLTKYMEEAKPIEKEKTTRIPTETPKPAVDERELWMSAIKDETWKWGRGRQDIFNNYWWKYYPDRNIALEEVQKFLRNNKVFSTIV